MKDTKIYLITCLEEVNGRMMKIVSHGVGNNTMNNYVLSQDPISNYPTKRDELGVYIDTSDDE